MDALSMPANEETKAEVNDACSRHRLLAQLYAVTGIKLYAVTGIRRCGFEGIQLYAVTGIMLCAFEGIKLQASCDAPSQASIASSRLLHCVGYGVFCKIQEGHVPYKSKEL